MLDNQRRRPRQDDMVKSNHGLQHMSCGLFSFRVTKTLVFWTSFLTAIAKSIWQRTCLYFTIFISWHDSNETFQILIQCKHLWNFPSYLTSRLQSFVRIFQRSVHSEKPEWSDQGWSKKNSPAEMLEQINLLCLFGWMSVDNLPKLQQFS